MLKIRKKNNQGMILFLGARAGSLFHSQAFYEMLKGYSSINFDIRSPTEQFAECYKVLQKGRFSEKEVDTILTSSLRYTAVAEAHTCVAELIKEGVFDIVISTNIDNHLEDALKELGMKEQYDFGVFLPDPERESFQEFLFSEPRQSCKIIKAFGDLSSRIYNISKRDFWLDAILGIKKNLEHILARDVLVIGFDPIWDAEMLRVFPVDKNSLWLVSEEDRHPFSSLARHGRQIKQIVGKAGGFEQFFKALYWQLYERMPINDQLVHETLNELRIIRHQLSQFEKISSQTQDVYQEVLFLKEMLNSYFEKKEGDNT
jgi:hypothetical protein